MRGEETGIAGFLEREPGFNGALCLPGTDTKWARVSAGEVVSFRTAMTGELFAAISGQTVPRHSVGTGGWDSETIAGAVEERCRGRSGRSRTTSRSARRGSRGGPAWLGAGTAFGPAARRGTRRDAGLLARAARRADRRGRSGCPLRAGAGRAGPCAGRSDGTGATPAGLALALATLMRSEATTTSRTRSARGRSAPAAWPHQSISVERGMSAPIRTKISPWR
jgi:2-dehydro-3-deoxygalactonokinase